MRVDPMTVQTISDNPVAFAWQCAGSPIPSGMWDDEMWTAASPKRRPSCPPSQGVCYLSGLPLEAVGLPASERIGATWTAHDTAVCAEGEWLHPAAVWALSEKSAAPPAGWERPQKEGEEKKPKKEGEGEAGISIRSMSHLFVAAEGKPAVWELFGLSDKRKMAAVLLSPPQGAWLMTLTSSPLSAGHQIHTAVINPQGGAEWAVSLDGERVRSSSHEFGHVLGLVEEMYRHKHSKSAIQTGEYNPKFINEMGVEPWARLEAQLSEWRYSPVFDLALFLAQLELEEDKTDGN